MSHSNIPASRLTAEAINLPTFHDYFDHSDERSHWRHDSPRLDAHVALAQRFGGGC